MRRQLKSQKAFFILSRILFKGKDWNFYHKAFLSLCPLNNGKGQFGCVSCTFTMYFINRNTHTHTYKHIYLYIIFIHFLIELWNNAYEIFIHIFLPFTDTEAMISAEPKTFSPWQTYFPSSDLEAFRIRRLPSGRIAILKIIKKKFFSLFYWKSAK